MTSLHVICGLGLPNQKFWLHLEIGDCLKNFFKDLFFWRTLAAVFLVVGLEHSSPWPRKGLSSERLSLALASSLVSSTPPLVNQSEIKMISRVKLNFISWVLVIQICGMDNKI